MHKTLTIGVFSAKGGVGKSLIAANLAVAFARWQKLSTVLVDLVPGLGYADLLLDLEPAYNWGELLPVIEELEQQHFDLALTPHASGLKLLAAPKSFQTRLDPKALQLLLQALHRQFTVVVLDTSTGLQGVNAAAYHLSRLRLMVLTPDAPALRSTQRLLSAIPSDQEKAVLLLNQYTSGTPLSVDDVHEALQHRVVGVLPADPEAVWLNVGYGQPCVLKRRSGLGQALRQLAVRSARLLTTPPRRA